MQWSKLDYALRGAAASDDVTLRAGRAARCSTCCRASCTSCALAGLPVSMTENLDAMRAVEHVPLDDRDAFKAALGATLVKHHGHDQGVRHRVRGVLLDVQPGRRRGRRTGDGDADAQADFEQLRAAMDGGGAMGQRVQRGARADAPRRADEHGHASSCACSRRPRWRASRAWSRAARSAARTTCTARCGSSTPTASSAR